MTPTMQRISEICQAGAEKARQPDHDRLAELRKEKTYQLRLGVHILTTHEHPDREKWLTNYTSLCHTINQLEAAA